MNIFILSTDPRIAALYHCDQHRNKMIVESAQMASTVAAAAENHCWFSEDFSSSLLMKPAYSHHPCTRWAGKSPANLAWLLQLATSLEELRASATESAASPVIRYLSSQLAVHADWREHTPFAFAGPKELAPSEPSDSAIEAAYQSLYRAKFHSWLGRPWRMSYRDSILPPFLADLSAQIPHAFPFSIPVFRSYLDLLGVK